MSVEVVVRGGSGDATLALQSLRIQAEVVIVGKGRTAGEAVAVAGRLSEAGLVETGAVITGVVNRVPVVKITVRRGPSFVAGFVAQMRSRAENNPSYFFVGCCTQALGHVTGKAKGVQVIRRPRKGWGAGEGKVVFHADQALTGDNPSYVAVSFLRNTVYVCNENAVGTEDPGCRALRFDPSTGELTLLNTKPTFGFAACHIALDFEEKFVGFANYMSTEGRAAFVVYRIEDDGSLGELVAKESHTPLPSRPIGGPGTKAHRQADGSHAHQILFSRNRKGGVVMYVADLGLDAVYGYNFDGSAPSGEVVRLAFTLALEPGDGPRHCAMHPDGTRLYIACEMSSFCVECSVADDGSLSVVDRHPTLPKGHPAHGDDAKNTTAAIHMGGSNGEMCLVANRGDDSVAVFATHTGGGGSGLAFRRVAKVTSEKEHGELPAGPDGWKVTVRDFRVLRGGSLLVVASQNNDFIRTLQQSPKETRAPTADGAYPASSVRTLTDAALTPQALVGY